MTYGNNGREGELGVRDMAVETLVVVVQADAELLERAVLVYATVQVLLGRMQVGLPFQRLKRAGLGLVGKLGRLKELEQIGRQGDKDLGRVAQ